MKITSTALIAALREAGYEPRPYSGRGMGGAECVAVDPSDLPGGLFALGCRLGPDYEGLRVSEDSLGQGTVAYFRGVGWAS